jgi:hypothetical protein
MEERIAGLERQVRRLRVAVGLLLAGVGLDALVAFSPRQEPRILRAEGIVIVDAQGRDRILIGAPVLASPARIRTDPDKAGKAWASRYPRFNWYAGLRHATNGIVLLDEEAFDRIVMGDPAPDPNIGRRIAPSTGIAINDQQGFERTGWGYFPTLNRVVLGLDDDKGSEGVVLVVNEAGEAGVRTQGKESGLFLGYAEPGGDLSTLDRPFSGFLIKPGKNVKHRLDAFGGK